MATAKKSTKSTKTTKAKTAKVTKPAPKAEKVVKTQKTTKTVKAAPKKVERKNGKKCLIAIIIVAIVAVLAAAGVFVYTKFFSAPNIVGTYELTGMESNGEDQSASLGVLKGLGLEATLELKEDKTGKLNLFGEESDVTYNKDQITINDDTANYNYKDGTITLEENGTKLIFSIKK